MTTFTAESEKRAWDAVTRAETIRNLLIESHLSWAQNVVIRLCRRRAIPVAEIEGAAADGLMRAARKYDPFRGVTFRAFARRHVWGATYDFARKNDPRQFEHGTRPKYNLARLPEAAAGPAVKAESTAETKDMARAVIRSITGDVRRELWVRCALQQENVSDAALALGLPVKTAKLEMEAAGEEAAIFARKQGMAGADAKAVKPPARQRKAKPTMDLSSLVIVAASVLAAGGTRPTAEVQVRTLTGLCTCGTQVLGPSAPAGRARAECHECGKRVELA